MIAAGETVAPVAEPVVAGEAVAAAPIPAAADFVMPEAMSAERWAEPAVAASSAEAKPVTAAVVEPLVAAVQMPDVAVAAAPEVEIPAAAESVAETIADAPDAAAETKSNGFDLTPLMARLSQRPVMAFAPTGRMIVLMESEPLASNGLPAALADAFARTGSVLMVDFGGDSAGETGFTDVVAGEADFVEVIRADGPGGAHRVAAGLTETGVLFDDPAAVAFALEAMAEVYEWVVCRLRQGEEATELLALVSTLADSVVIASNADPSDETLADLYAVASDAGAGQVLIAQDRPSPRRRPNWMGQPPSRAASRRKRDFSGRNGNGGGPQVRRRFAFGMDRLVGRVERRFLTPAAQAPPPAAKSAPGHRPGRGGAACGSCRRRRRGGGRCGRGASCAGWRPAGG